MKKPAKTSSKSGKAAQKADKAKPAKKAVKKSTQSSKKAAKAVKSVPNSKGQPKSSAPTPKNKIAKSSPVSPRGASSPKKSEVKTKLSEKDKNSKPSKVSTPQQSNKPSKPEKKKKVKDDDLDIPVEEIKDLEIELLPELTPKNKGNKKKIVLPPTIDEEEEIKPTFAAKSLTQALVGPPPTPPKAEPVTKTKSKYQKFELEFLVHSSVRLLFEFISTPSGLSEWFADDVNFRNGIYSFFWDKVEQKAKMLQMKENKSVRFQWLEDSKDIYFEFRIEVDDLTGDVALIITDFAEDDESREAATLLWNSQVDSLLKALGSY